MTTWPLVRVGAIESPAIFTLLTPHALMATTISNVAPSFRGSARATISQPNIRCDGARSSAAADPSVGWTRRRAHRVRRLRFGACAACDRGRLPCADARAVEPWVGACIGCFGGAPTGHAGRPVWPAAADRGGRRWVLDREFPEWVGVLARGARVVEARRRVLRGAGGWGGNRAGRGRGAAFAAGPGGERAGDSLWSRHRHHRDRLPAPRTALAVAVLGGGHWGAGSSFHVVPAARGQGVAWRGRRAGEQLGAAASLSAGVAAPRARDRVGDRPARGA